VNDRQLLALTDPYDGTTPVDRFMATDPIGDGLFLASALAVDR
jgi:hypothetical protein